MNNLENIKNFYNNQFGNLTVIIDENDGNPWFIGKEVAEMLGYAITRKAIKDHVDEEDKKVINKNSVPKRYGIISAGNPNIILINETGLYKLINFKTTETVVFEIPRRGLTLINESGL